MSGKPFIFTVAAIMLSSLNAQASVRKCGLASNVRQMVPETKRSSSEHLEHLHRQYPAFTKITVPEKEKYMNLLEHDDGTENVHGVFSLGNLQRLNSPIINNKVHVDGIGNYYKEIVFKKIHDDPFLSSRLNAQYESYKDLAFAFKKGRNSKEIERRLEAIAQQSAQEFRETIESFGIKHLYEHETGISADPLTWHRVGIGNTAQLASLWARFAEEENYLPKKLQVGTAQSQRHKAEAALIRLESLDKSLSKNAVFLNPTEVDPHIFGEPDVFSSAPRVLMESANGRHVITSHTLYLMKIAKSPEDLQRLMQSALRLPVKPTLEEVNTLYEWRTILDYFSPDVQSVERVSVHSAPAKFGVVADDYRLLSGRKYQATNEGLNATDQFNVESAVKNVKFYFDLDHQLLLKQHEALGRIFKKAFITSDMHVSGDEVMHIPDGPIPKFKERKVVLGIQGDPLKLELRTVHTLISDVAERSPVIAKSEKFEKELRNRLMDGKKLNMERLDRTHFHFRITNLKTRDGKFRFKLVYTGPMDKADEKAIKQVLLEMQKEHPELTANPKFVRHWDPQKNAAAGIPEPE